MGRTVANLYAQIGRLTGEKMPASQEKALEKPGLLENCSQ